MHSICHLPPCHPIRHSVGHRSCFFRAALGTTVTALVSLALIATCRLASADDGQFGPRLAPVVVARFHLSDEPPVIDPGEPRVIASEEPTTTGRSPYDAWPDRGMRPERDAIVEREELFPVQVAWINAAYGGQDYRGGEHRCAGCAMCVRRRAVPSDTGRYVGYYVGGGTVLRGEGRYLDEGTWGWDYRGLGIEPRIMLGWSHSRVQSGTGAYATDRRK